MSELEIWHFLSIRTEGPPDLSDVPCSGCDESSGEYLPRTPVVEEVLQTLEDDEAHCAGGKLLHQTAAPCVPGSHRREGQYVTPEVEKSTTSASTGAQLSFGVWTAMVAKAPADSGPASPALRELWFAPSVYPFCALGRCTPRKSRCSQAGDDPLHRRNSIRACRRSDRLALA